MEPHMQQKDIDMLCHLIEKYKPATILEWGSGGSTTTFPKKYKNIINKWISIEHNSTWFNKIKNDLSENATVHLISTNEYVKNETTKKYIEIADFIFVDGLDNGSIPRRNLCLEFAQKYCRNNALVLLHDSDRPGIQNWFNYLFPFNKKLTTGRFPHPNGGYKGSGLAVFYKIQDLI